MKMNPGNRKIQRRWCRFFGHKWKRDRLMGGVMPSWTYCKHCKVEIDYQEFLLPYPGDIGFKASIHGNEGNPANA